MAHRQALDTEGVRQITDNLPGEVTALVPAAKLPSSAELEKTGPESGPRQFRPKKSGGWGGTDTVHLCEHLACKLPPERFWERRRSGKEVHAGGNKGP